MEKIKLSIVLLGICPEEWKRVYDSIQNSFTGSWEIIIIGPKHPDDYVKNKNNVKYVQSLASPTRCLQEATLHADGEYLHHAVEDTFFVPGGLDKCMKFLDSSGNKEKTIVCCKYLEGVSTNRTHLFPKKQRKRRIPGHIDHFLGGKYIKSDIAVYGSDAHWKINFHPSQASPFIPDDWNIIHLGIMKKSYFIYLGGMDCKFQVSAMAHADLAARANRDGAEIQVSDDFVVHANNTIVIPHKSKTGHSPVIYTQIEEDQPLYRSIYDNPNCINRTRIDFDNWKQAPDIWDKRDFTV